MQIFEYILRPRSAQQRPSGHLSPIIVPAPTGPALACRGGFRYGLGFEPTQRYTAVIADIDRANADDPRTIIVFGKTRPYEVVHSERMTERLAAMYPDAAELLLIAARGQLIRRFDIRRAQFTEGRNGYNEWRRTCREHHAKLLRDIMSRHGYNSEAIEYVTKLVRKEQLKKDKES